RVARAKGPINQEKLKQRYRRLLETTSRVVGQAKRFSNEVAEGVNRSADILRQLALDGPRQQLDTMLPLVRQVMRHTRARILHGKTRTQGKILSVFEPATEVIRKGKLGKPNQFGAGPGTGWHGASAARALDADRMSDDERKAAADALRRALGLLEKG